MMLFGIEVVIIAPGAVKTPIWGKAEQEDISRYASSPFYPALQKIRAMLPEMDAHGLPADFIRGVNARNHHENAWAQFESSRCTLEEFDQLFLEESRALGHPVPGRVVIDLLGGDLRPRMVEVLKRLKQDYRVACLTNNFKIFSLRQQCN